MRERGTQRKRHMGEEILRSYSCWSSSWFSCPLERPLCSVLSIHHNPKGSILKLLITIGTVTTVIFQEMLSVARVRSEGPSPSHDRVPSREGHTLFAIGASPLLGTVMLRVRPVKIRQVETERDGEMASRETETERHVRDRERGRGGGRGGSWKDGRIRNAGRVSHQPRSENITCKSIGFLVAWFRLH